MPGRIRVTIEERRHLTGPALRSFFKLAEAWELTACEQRALLGYPSSPTLRRWRAGAIRTLTSDTLERISLLLGIYGGINQLLPVPARADAWIRASNQAPIFRGRSALEVMSSGEISDLYLVRRYLGALVDDLNPGVIEEAANE